MLILELILFSDYGLYATRSHPWPHFSGFTLPNPCHSSTLTPVDRPCMSESSPSVYSPSQSWVIVSAACFLAPDVVWQRHKGQDKGVALVGDSQTHTPLGCCQLLPISPSHNHCGCHQTKPSNDPWDNAFCGHADIQPHPGWIISFILMYGCSIVNGHPRVSLVQMSTTQKSWPRFDVFYPYI